MKTMYAKETVNGKDWTERHNNAASVHPTLDRIGSNPPAQVLELAMVAMMKGMALYAEAHKLRYDTAIGNDYVLGPAVAEIGKGLLTLLNGELGRMDGGTCDRFIRETLEDNGLNGDL